MSAETSTVEGEGPRGPDTLAAAPAVASAGTDPSGVILEVVRATAEAASHELAASVAALAATTTQRRRLREAILELHTLRDHSECARPALEAALQALRDELAIFSELGEQESVRLARAMDRLAKSMETLSNLLKQVSRTQDEIVSNLK